jgi:Concanavalin A-like lectin/glucanases superfamily
MYVRCVAVVLASLWSGACGRIGVQAVTWEGDQDADTPEIEDEAGMLEPDAGPPVEEELDASEALDAADGTLTDADAGPAAMDGGGSPSDAAADAAADGSLFLRYDFGGSGMTVSDRVGNNHGQVLGGAQLDGSGALTLDGVNDFVNMPNGLISRWSSVTVMVWVSWSGGPCWQRVFDFGSSSNGEDNAGSATSAFSLSPSSCPNGVVTGLFELSGDLRAVNGNRLTVGALTQVALALDGTRGTLTLFLNGTAVGEAAVPWQLSQLEDVNTWLGRSQWSQDKFMQGSLSELRIYSRALSSQEVATLNTRGPDAP